MIGSEKSRIYVKVSEKLIRSFLILFKNESLMRKRFDGRISNGIIDGHYHSLMPRLFDDTPYILKVKGVYSIERGELNLKLLPSNFFYVSLLFPLVMFILLGRSFFQGQIDQILFVIFLFIPTLITLSLFLGLFFKKKRFKKHFFELTEKAQE
jgi:hypothetical protein